MPRSVVGIDVGGTFTDIAVLQDGQLTVHKLPSTPQNPSLGIVQGVNEVGIAPESADFVHGSTEIVQRINKTEGTK
jgi:N-methylhydantoinase A/oxoprolinase/acetone carboxylase beta subunit